jgi:hypothetical protein
MLRRLLSVEAKRPPRGSATGAKLEKDLNNV